jgi:F0F1-type ATP synthase epsilon subunit
MSASPFLLSVVTPAGPVQLSTSQTEETVPLLRFPIHHVVLPLHDGYMGVESLHTPTIGKLGFGLLSIHTEKEHFSVYLDGGVVQIQENHITVLASLAKTAKQLQKEKLQQELATEGSSKSLSQQLQKEKLQQQLKLFA